MFFFTHLDGAQLATQLVGLAVIAIALVVGLVMKLRADKAGVLSAGPIACVIVAAFSLAFLVLIVPLTVQDTRNDNTDERAALTEYAEFYGYQATDIHANSNEFTALFDDNCSFPAKYYLDDGDVISTEATVSREYIYGLSSPHRLVFQDWNDVSDFVEVLHYCALQDRAEAILSD
jgi:hypothetical protein